MTRMTIVMLVFILPAAASAQRVPDPDKVAPQFHDAAETRRAEIFRTKACTDKATREKVLKRDMAAYINRCIDARAEAHDTVESKTKP